MITHDLLPKGHIFSKEYYLTPDNVSAYAHACEDYNPLHHDAVFATQTRFAGLIACGPHYASLLLGLAATHFSQYGATLGLEFNLKFVKAAAAQQKITLRWTIQSYEDKPKLQGRIYEIAGEVLSQAGEPLLLATGKMLLTQSL
jgi:3-hydroxybutyryl-CoA dehydratase